MLKSAKIYSFFTFKEFKDKSATSKVADQAFEAGDFLKFWGFRGSFSKKKFSYKKTCTSVFIEITQVADIK